MDAWKVVEKENPLAVHCLTWSEERAEYWIDKNGDSGRFMDKSLTKDSFIAVENKED
jgi:hypothetical protein